MPRAMKSAARKRKFRRNPALRQLGERTPSRRADVATGSRPAQQHAIVIAIRTEPVEQSPRIGFALGGQAPPAVPHRIQRLGFRIGEPQARGDALGVFGHRDRQRGEPPRAAAVRPSSRSIAIIAESGPV